MRALNTVKHLLLATFVLNLSVLASCAADGLTVVQTEHRSVTIRPLVKGLDHPWSLAFISATDWLVTERAGRLRRVVDGQLLAEPVGGVPGVANSGQGGLLDVALHPDFADNAQVYLSYANGSSGAYGTEVIVGTLDGNQLIDTRVIFKALPKYSGGRHFGSRLAFDDNGFLFISLGDRGARDTGQLLDEHPGSIIRLNTDGTVPADNPFVGNEDIQPEIYSYGHRNVQGMVFDTATGTLWAHEHGPQGGDELNRVEAGKNYGWPVITYGGEYVSGSAIGEGTAKAGMEQPVRYWVPSIAPSGMALVTSDRYPDWQGNLLVGALKYQLLARLELDGQQVIKEERFLDGKIGRIRDVRQGPDGYLYVLTDSGNGGVFRLE